MEKSICRAAPREDEDPLYCSCVELRGGAGAVHTRVNSRKTEVYLPAGARARESMEELSTSAKSRARRGCGDDRVCWRGDRCFGGYFPGDSGDLRENGFGGGFGFGFDYFEVDCCYRNLLTVQFARHFYRLNNSLNLYRKPL